MEEYAVEVNVERERRRARRIGQEVREFGSRDRRACVCAVAVPPEPTPPRYSQRTRAGEMPAAPRTHQQVHPLRANQAEKMLTHVKQAGGRAFGATLATASR